MSSSSAQNAREIVLKLLPEGPPGVRAKELQNRLEAYALATVRQACRDLARDGLARFQGRLAGRRYYRTPKT